MATLKMPGDLTAQTSKQLDLPRRQELWFILHWQAEDVDAWELPVLGLNFLRRQNQNVEPCLAEVGPFNRYPTLKQVSQDTASVDKHGRKIPGFQLPGTIRFDRSSIVASSRMRVTDAIVSPEIETVSLPPLPVLTMRSPSGVTLP